MKVVTTWFYPACSGSSMKEPCIKQHTLTGLGFRVYAPEPNRSSLFQNTCSRFHDVLENFEISGNTKGALYSTAVMMGAMIPIPTFA